MHHLFKQRPAPFKFEYYLPNHQIPTQPDIALPPEDDTQQLVLPKSKKRSILHHPASSSANDNLERTTGENIERTNTPQPLPILELNIEHSAPYKPTKRRPFTAPKTTHLPNSQTQDSFPPPPTSPPIASTSQKLLLRDSDIFSNIPPSFYSNEVTPDNIDVQTTTEERKTSVRVCKILFESAIERLHELSVCSYNTRLPH